MQTRQYCCLYSQQDMILEDIRQLALAAHLLSSHYISLESGQRVRPLTSLHQFIHGLLARLLCLLQDYSQRERGVNLDELLVENICGVALYNRVRAYSLSSTLELNYTLLHHLRRVLSSLDHHDHL